MHVCHADLEDELVRCLGTDAVLEVIAAPGELALVPPAPAPARPARPPLEAQLHRFFAGRSGHKITYASSWSTPSRPAPPAPFAALVEAATQGP